MTIDVDRSTIDFSGRVAEEIRALLARRRMSGRELARLLGVSHAWVGYRLAGSQPIDLNDAWRIAEALGVGIVDLLPRSARDSRATLGSAKEAVDLPMPRRPRQRIGSSGPTVVAMAARLTPLALADFPRPAPNRRTPETVRLADAKQAVLAAVATS